MNRERDHYVRGGGFSPEYLFPKPTKLKTIILYLKTIYDYNVKDNKFASNFILDNLINLDNKHIQVETIKINKWLEKVQNEK